MEGEDGVTKAPRDTWGLGCPCGVRGHGHLECKAWISLGINLILDLHHRGQVWGLQKAEPLPRVRDCLSIGDPACSKQQLSTEQRKKQHWAGGPVPRLAQPLHRLTPRYLELSKPAQPFGPDARSVETAPADRSQSGMHRMQAGGSTGGNPFDAPAVWFAAEETDVDKNQGGCSGTRVPESKYKQNKFSALHLK